MSIKKLSTSAEKEKLEKSTITLKDLVKIFKKYFQTVLFIGGVPLSMMTSIIYLLSFVLPLGVSFVLGGTIGLFVSFIFLEGLEKKLR